MFATITRQQILDGRNKLHLKFSMISTFICIHLTHKLDSKVISDSGTYQERSRGAEIHCAVLTPSWSCWLWSGPADRRAAGCCPLTGFHSYKDNLAEKRCHLNRKCFAMQCYRKDVWTRYELFPIHWNVIVGLQLCLTILFDVNIIHR